MNDNSNSSEKAEKICMKKLKEPLTFRQLWLPVIVFILIEIILFFCTDELWLEFILASLVSVGCGIAMIFRTSVTRAVHFVASLVPSLFFLSLLFHNTRNCNYDTISEMAISTISNYFDHKNDWVAIIIAIFSLVYAVYTWRSQESTQKNTQRITPEIQKGILLDFFRHSYRNMIILAAIRNELKNKGFENFFPAEYHILKMQTDESAIYPEIFLDNTESCGRLHEFRLFVRNGNIEIKVINDHLKNPNLNAVIKEHDLDVLGKRIKDIVERTSLLIKDLYNIKDSDLAINVSDYLGKKPLQQSTKNYEDHKKKVESAITTAAVVKSHAYTVEQDYTAFIEVLFPTEDVKTLEDMDIIRKKDKKEVFAKNKSDFLDIFNADVYLEIPKIDLIPF